MADIVDKATRSRMMASIKGKNTRPEVFVRKALHAAGFRFRLHVKDLPGKPDIVLPKYNAVVFVHGCFWHGHECSLHRVPKTNKRFWEKKFKENRRRDQKQKEQLSELGFRILTVWECSIRAKALKDHSKTAEKCNKWILSKSRIREIGGQN